MVVVCPECGSENIRHFKNFDECIDCYHREPVGPKVKRKSGVRLTWEEREQ